MSTTETEGGRLFKLYASYVGEPESKKDVWGYWFFLAGALVSFAGVVLFLYGPTNEAAFLFRGLAMTLSAAGLPVALLGIVLLLPVKRISIFLTVLGTLASIGASGAFAWAYPDHWPPLSPGAVDYSQQIIAGYTGGLAVIVLVAVLVPIFTGEKSLFFEKTYERGREHPPAAVGETLKDGMFSVYRDDDEWQWRMISQEAIAGNIDAYLSRLETEETVDSIKEKVEEAGLLEIKHAAFRLYEAAENRWRWVLMGEDGNIFADSDEEFETRNDAAEAVNNLKELGPDADVIDIEGDGAFEFVEDGGDVRWRLVDEERNMLAESGQGYDDHDAAESGMEFAKESAVGARTLTVETIGVELFEPDDGGGWHWRLLDESDEELARSEDGFDDRRRAEEEIYDLLEDVAGAPILDSAQPAYEVVPADGDNWQFRLVDDDENVVGHSFGTVNTPKAAGNLAERMRTTAGDADVVSIDGAEFEYFPTGDGYMWRLVTEDREVLAESAGAYPDKNAAAEAVEVTQDMVGDADLIEFENAAFQLYEHQGEWRWRLIDEDGNVMADSGEEHDSKDSAAESMMTIKEQAPDAEMLEIENAAFELFHDDEENWNWRLVDLAGEMVARGPEMLSSKADAREAMDRLKDQGDDAEGRAMEAPVFQAYADDDDEWRWQFVDVDGSVVAGSDERYGTRDETVTDIEGRVRPSATDGDIYTIEDVALQVDARGERYSWRLLSPRRETLATSSNAYAERGQAADEVERFRDQAEEAVVFELSEPAFQLRGTEAGWTWRLLDVDRSVVMQATASFENKEQAGEAVERVEDVIETADLLDYEGAAFELLESDEGDWKWRLVDEVGETFASSAQTYSTRDACEEALDRVREKLEAASILEIEIAAFELQEDAGRWRWRLIDANGNPIAQSLRAYDGRRDAREAMESFKEYAPDAMTSVAE